MTRVHIDILGISELKWTGMAGFNSDDHCIYYCWQQSLRRNGVAFIVNKSQKCSTWVQSQKWQNDLCSFLRQTIKHQFSSVQSLSRVRLLATPWTTAHQASLSITNSRSLPKLMSIESVMPSNNLILCRPLLLLPSIFPNIRVFSDESALHIRWPKYCSFSFNISPSMNTQDWFPLGWTGWISLQSKGLSRVFSNTTVQKHQFFCTQIFL